MFDLIGELIKAIIWAFCIALFLFMIYAFFRLLAG